MEQGPLGLNPELRTPPLPATHVRAGTGHRVLARNYTTDQGRPSYLRVHSLRATSCRNFLPELNPHTEHNRLDGNQRLTLTTVRWQRSAFSSNNRTRVDQPASATDFANRVRASPDTARSST